MYFICQSNLYTDSVVTWKMYSSLGKHKNELITKLWFITKLWLKLNYVWTFFIQTSEVLSPKKWIVLKSFSTNCRQKVLFQPTGNTSILICPPIANWSPTPANSFSKAALNFSRTLCSYKNQQTWLWKVLSLTTVLHRYQPIMVQFVFFTGTFCL